MIDHTALPAYRSNTCDIVNHSNFVISVHHTDHSGVFSDGISDHLRRCQSVGIGLEISHLVTFALELTTGIQHSLVLDLRRDDVLAFTLVEMRRTLNCQVVRFGCARGPDNLTRISIDQFRHLTSSVFDSLLGLPAVLMRSRRRIPEDAIHGKTLHHCLCHSRINRGRGQVIKINRYTHNGCIHRLFPHSKGKIIAIFCTVLTTASLQPSGHRSNPILEPHR